MEFEKEILTYNDEVYEIEREYFAKPVYINGEVYLVEDEDA